MTTRRRPTKTKTPKTPPRRVPIAFRIDPRVLRALRRTAHDRGTGYQTLMHDILRRATIGRARPGRAA